MIAEIFAKLSEKRDLTPIETHWAMEAIVTGSLSDTEIEKFLIGLRDKGETETEICAAAGVLAQHAVKLSKPFPDLLDTCGTGGDGRSSLNVSTLAAIVACAAGARIGKHGNRAVSGKTGSADLLELLGMKIDHAPRVWERSIEATGFAFFFAPLYHPAVRQASAARKRIAGKTLFNVLGPLLNPARASRRLMGVYDPRLLRLIGPALQQNGAVQALVVRGQDGFDEVSLTGRTDAVRYVFGKGASTENLLFDPQSAGLVPCRLDALVCKSPEESRRDALAVLGNVPGPKTEWTLLNAGAALWIGGQAPDLRGGVARAREALASGAALKKLEQIIEFTRSTT